MANFQTNSNFQVEQNEAFQLAADFIRFTQLPVFVTGKAGTGKTTFLKHCKENPVKNTAIVAPTGVAAINAGGTTIHSFFQLPFSPFIPTSGGFNASETTQNKHSLMSQLRLSNDRREVLQELELLIIDEISMVRCDVLDAIDTILKQVRQNQQQAFGGVQVVFIGDLHQLPPVIKEDEWQLLQPYYQSPFFFSSQVVQENPPVYVELTTVYRQRDEQFVDILNKIRNNQLDTVAYDQLHQRYQPHLDPAREENYITLTTHNNKADLINQRALAAITGKTFNYQAQVTGDFNDKSYPAEAELQLKEGAQVMFIKNDIEKVRRYFNGKIGVIAKLEADKIFVRCNDLSDLIEVKKETWRNIRYSVDKETQLLEENELGSFSQFPLRLAWAITIHKSQGLTFEKAIIDAGDSFAHGQVYVALSRCTSLEGMILHSRIQPASLQSDARVAYYSNLQPNPQQQKEILNQGKRIFQINEIRQLFDFRAAEKQIQQIVAWAGQQLQTFNPATLPWLLDLEKAIESLQILALKFEPQLLHLLQQPSLPELNEPLQDRIKAAANHFKKLVKEQVAGFRNCPIQTDSKVYAVDGNRSLQQLYENLQLQLHVLEGVENGFKQEAFLLHRRAYHKANYQINIYAGAKAEGNADSPHPDLYKQLRQKRTEICNEKNIPVYQVISTAAIEEMAKYLPQTLEDLHQISGFGPVKIKVYGETFLSIIQEYCELHNLHSNIETLDKKAKKKTEKKLANKESEKTPKAAKVDTKQASFDLYQSGKAIAEIAAERGISIGTVENHLAAFIERGEISVNEFVETQQQHLIELAIQSLDNPGLKAIHEFCQGKVNYSEIKMVSAALKAKENG
ncbi:MAG: hypothetical protein RLY16_798 [Bacteroidota bacterium]